MAVNLRIIGIFAVERISREVAPCDDKYHSNRDYQDSFAAVF